jgi:hypothetical protein
LSVLDTTQRVSLTPVGSILRVDIDGSTGKNPWQLQLYRAPVRIEEGRSYQFLFQARAAASRTIGAVVTLGHAPWTPLGPGEFHQLDTTWQSFGSNFVSIATDSAAFLRFDVAGHDADVEFRDVALREASGSRVDLLGATSYSLAYHFDSLGCRGPQRSVAKDSATLRVLALGDSYTLGAGVRGDDAWPARLEALLNSSSRPAGAQRVQVFNCAVAGAGAANARARADSLVDAIDPHLVLLGLVLGDEKSGSDDVTVPRLHLRGIDHLLRSVRWLRYRGAERDMLAGVNGGIPAIQDEVARLESVARSAGSRVAVLLLQDRQSPAWDTFVTAMTDSTRTPEVPVLALGKHFRIFTDADRFVLPPVDAHPSRTVHRTIAEATANFVAQRKLLDPAVDSTPAATAPGTQRNP